MIVGSKEDINPKPADKHPIINHPTRENPTVPSIVFPSGSHAATGARGAARLEGRAAECAKVRHRALQQEAPPAWEKLSAPRLSFLFAVLVVW